MVMFFFLVLEQPEVKLVEKNQYLVDYTYQFDFAKMASENNIKIFSLISSLGANQNSFSFIQELKEPWKIE